MKTDEVQFGVVWTLGLGKYTKFGRGLIDVCRRIENYFGQVATKCDQQFFTGILVTDALFFR
jgi:hypothetical protein